MWQETQPRRQPQATRPRPGSRPTCCLPLVLLALVWCALPVTDAWSAYSITTAAFGASSVFAADLDADGRIDVLSASESFVKVAWYKNGGGSPLTWTAFTITTADGANSVYAADLDADGRIDVLSASYNDDKVAWYKNGGSSPLTWTAYNITTTADGARSVFAADLDADGRIDVLSASRNDRKVAWYKNGGGSPLTWTAYTITTAAFGARSVFAADLDADGRIDVLSASESDNTVAWYKKSGGSWMEYTITTAADGAFSVFAADLDADGRIDVLSASYADNKVAWYKNGGDSPLTWTAYTITTVASGASSVFAADLDADGRIDVLSAFWSDDKVAWYKNGGGSPLTWTAFTITTAADGANSVYAADLDADGRIDVLSASDNDNKVAWYKNSGCLPGFYVVSGACQPCPAGRFSLSGLTNACSSCAAGRFGATAAMNTSACSGNCTAGYSCPLWSTNGTVSVCPVGQFSNSGAPTCSVCAAGLFGAVAAINTSACSGNCTAGYACPAGSTNATVSPCPVGRYSLSGAGLCQVCAAGRYGALSLMTNASCTAACPAGTFGSASGLSTSVCSGNCTAGYACPTGSTSATAVQCPPGSYSLVGAGACEPCPGGRFGASAALSSSVCTGTCTAGYFCPAGSTSPTQGTCPPGQYSIAGAASCTNCSAGRYGASPGTNTPSCDAVCNPGYVCPPGSIMGAPPGGQCPAGQYAFTGALVCANCTAGYACVSGSGLPSPGANVCPAGRWSVAGAVSCTDCAAGYVGTTAGASNANCSGPCPAGQWSPAGATTCSLCPAGHACPTGTTNGTAFPCFPGTYTFDGAGTCSPCIAGRYGAAAAMESSVCSGACSPGWYCPAGSTNATAVQCPAGQYCGLGAGAPQPCAPGFYGNAAGLATAQCSGVCPPGYYCPGGSMPVRAWSSSHAASSEHYLPRRVLIF